MEGRSFNRYFEPLSTYNSASQQKKNSKNENFTSHRTDRKNSLTGFNKQILQDSRCQNIDNSLTKLKKHTLAPTKNEDKNMIEFIMNLKSKKTQKKIGQTAFNFEQSNKQDLLCNKMLFIKKLQKLQKSAINHFYQKEYQKCFGELQECEELINKERITTAQHSLYINYLYSEFYYKLNKLEEMKKYLLKAKNIIKDLKRQQIVSLNQYIDNIKVLDICVACQNKQFQNVLEMIKQIKKGEALGSKIRRRIAEAEINSLKALYKIEEALNAIAEQEISLMNDEELSLQKRTNECLKLTLLQIEINRQFNSLEKAISFIEEKISFRDVCQCKIDYFTNQSNLIFQKYAKMLLENDQLVKLIFFYRKWLSKQTQPNQRLQIQLELFILHYKVGDFQQALNIFQDTSAQNLVKIGHEYLEILAQIKKFQGDEIESLNIIIKLADLAENIQSKLGYTFKLLEYDLQQKGYQIRSEIQRSLQKLLKLRKGSFIKISSQYAQYLKMRGDRERSIKWQNFSKAQGKRQKQVLEKSPLIDIQ